MPGHRINIINPKAIIPTKGKAPRNTLLIDCLAIALTTNRFIPIGGVITANSIFTIKIIPKYIGSIPKSLSVGSNIGTTINMTEIISKKQPKTKSKTFMSSMNKRGVISNFVISSVTAFGICS